jgi:two-component system KDP operon response regulator KdpE
MSSNRPSILVVEDELQIRRFVRSALESEDWHVVEAETAQRGLGEIGARKPDLVVLDLGLPDKDGIDFIRDVRSWSVIPILVLSARALETDKIAALDAGADDYLTKPFSTGELLARVRAMLRRLSRGPVDSKAVVAFGDICVDLGLRSVTRSGNPLHLTPIEYRLLTYLISQTGKVLTHKQLLTDVWGQAQAHNSPSLRVFMTHLRQKIEQQPSQPRHLLTEIGIGYRFVL